MGRLGPGLVSYEVGRLVKTAEGRLLDSALVAQPVWGIGAASSFADFEALIWLVGYNMKGGRSFHFSSRKCFKNLGFRCNHGQPSSSS